MTPNEHEDDAALDALIEQARQWSRAMPDPVDDDLIPPPLQGLTHWWERLRLPDADNPRVPVQHRPPLDSGPLGVPAARRSCLNPRKPSGATDAHPADPPSEGPTGPYPAAR